MSSTTQRDVTNALTAAMQAIAESNAQAQDATLTIEAEIVEVIDEGLGTYKVLYLGNKFEATTAHTEITYEVGDMVYVVVPNGNFDKNKIILSPVTPSTAAYATTDNGHTYVTLGENLFSSVSDVALCTYKPHDADPSGTDPSPIVAIDTTGFAALFQSALSDSRTFNFTCKIQTNIAKERRTKGNYGLILDIPVNQAINGSMVSKYYSVVMDINNITGDPYNLQVPALQNFYFDLPEDMVYDESNQPRIRSFVVGFLGEDPTAPDDIFIRNIQLLSAFELSDEDKEGYFATITASQGTSFLASRTDDAKTLSVTAYLNGKVTRLSNFDCYWFKENVSIDATSDKFQRFGGIGWEILNQVSKKTTNDDGTISYQYVTNVYTQNITQAEIHCDTRFKCVLVNGEKVVPAITTIKNLASNATLKLTTTTGSTLFPVGVGDVELQLTYKESGITDVTNPSFVVGYAWQRFDKKGDYLDSDFFTIKTYNEKKNNTFTTIISYPTSELDEINTIACTVYVDTPTGATVKRQTIGTVWLTVATGEASAARITVTNGNKLYKYDADGDSPMVADYDGPLSSVIKEIAPLSITVFKEDGKELTPNEYAVTTITWLVPVQSMITLTQAQKTDTTSNPGYYTIQGRYTNGYNTLAYGIANAYNKKKTNNTIIVKASAPSAVLTDEARASIPLQFLKDGEGGTNGSKYAAIVTYGGYGYGEIDAYGLAHKLQLIYAADNQTWYLYNPARPGQYSAFTSAQLGNTLYADGELVGNSSAVYSIFDSKYSYDPDAIVSPIDISSAGRITLNGNKWTNSSKNFCATIEAKVNATRTSTVASQTNSEEYIYAYYPIECTYVANHQFLPSCLPSMDGGFSKVIYASDGTNPQYDNTESFYITDAEFGEDIGSLYTYNWSASSNMRVENTTDAECKVTPSSKYDNGVAKNYVRAQMGRGQSQTRALEAQLAILQTQCTSETNRRTYYQTLQNNIDIFGNFDYNSYVNRITAVANFYNVKTKIVNSSKDLIKQAVQASNLANRYRYLDSGSLDNKVNAVYLLLQDRITRVERLATLASKLGTNSTTINDIRLITPQSLLINEEIDLTDNPRGCYFSINDAVNIYNNIVRGVYTNSYNALMSSTISSVERVVYGIISDLSDFVNNQKLYNLTKSYAGVTEESYRYTALYATLRQYVNTASTYASDSYSSLLENILRPMYESIRYYISFYQGGGYLSTIVDINNTITVLNNRISVIETMLLPGSDVSIIHIKPIIMIFNRYEMSILNGWDGNKLDMGDGYLIAPQVGAGKKETDNSFTGIVIGVKQLAEKSKTGQKIGLFGYVGGKQSIFLNSENGSAIFGVSGKGQIILEPSEDKAIIKSGNYSTTDKTGMQIDLTTPEIRFGSGNFVVSPEGHITAKGGGTIAGWKISDTQLYSNVSATNGRITLESAGTGKIFSHNHNALDNTSKGFYLSYDGMSIGNTFKITAAEGGKLEVGRLTGTRHWIINGNSSESYISYNTEAFNTTANSVYIGTNGISLGKDTFYVDRTGKLIANSGKIANIVIEKNSLHTDGKNSLTAQAKGFYLDGSNEGLFELSNADRSRYLNWNGTELTITGVINAIKGTIGQAPVVWNIGGDPGAAYIYTNSNDINVGGDNIYIGTNGMYMGRDNNHYFKYTPSNGLRIRGGDITGSTINGSEINGSRIYGGDDIPFSVDEEKIELGDFSVTWYNGRHIIQSYDERNGFGTGDVDDDELQMWAGYYSKKDFAFGVRGDQTVIINHLLAVHGSIQYQGEDLEDWVIDLIERYAPEPEPDPEDDEGGGGPSGTPSDDTNGPTGGPG